MCIVPQGLVPIGFNLFEVDPDVRVWFAARYLPQRLQLLVAAAFIAAGALAVWRAAAIQRVMRRLLGCGVLVALALALFVVPASAEGPVLVTVSPGHGLSLVDVIALVPLLAGTGLLAGGLWRRRQGLDAALVRRPWPTRAGAVVAGLGLGLLVASVFTFFWWWAIGAALLTTTLLAAAFVAARSAGPGSRSYWVRRNGG